LTITGFLGGFTSYSNLFVAGGWIKQLSVVGAAATIFMAVFAGIGAAWLGWRVARQ
jgi:fluoride ion exporter CrcB/FEX